MKKTILCFGDSNTHGYDTATSGRFDEQTRWTRRLQALLGEDFLVFEEGLGGRTACFEDPLTEGMCGLHAITPVLMTHEPLDLLIVMLGTNDVKERFCATPENIAKGMERLLQKALHTPAWRTRARILLICPLPITPEYSRAAFAGEMGAGCDVKSAALAPLYRETAARLGAAFLDAGTIPGIAMHPRDCMHLTAESHEALAACIAQNVRTQLMDA